MQSTSAAEAPSATPAEGEVLVRVENLVKHFEIRGGLLASIPRIGERRQRLEVIQGVVPNPLNLPSGCLFKRRCRQAMPVCDTAPPLQEIEPGHLSRCWLTPAGEPPAIGAGATAGVAEEAAAALSVGR